MRYHDGYNHRREVEDGDLFPVCLLRKAKELRKFSGKNKRVQCHVTIKLLVRYGRNWNRASYTRSPPTRKPDELATQTNSPTPKNSKRTRTQTPVHHPETTPTSLPSGHTASVVSDTLPTTRSSSTITESKITSASPTQNSFPRSLTFPPVSP